MGTAMIPGLWEAYVRLGFEHRVPVLFFRQVDDLMRKMFYGPTDEATHLQRAAAIEARGMPLVDWFRITPGYDGGDSYTRAFCAICSPALRTSACTPTRRGISMTSIL